MLTFNPPCTNISRLYALVAQLDRVSDYGSEGCGFDFCRARQMDGRRTCDGRFFTISFYAEVNMRRLLVVVDMQNDFVDGSLGFEGADGIIGGIVNRINEYKSSGDEVVYTLDTHHENYSDTQEGRNLPVSHCIEGTSGFELVPQLKDVLSSCRAFKKPTFGSMELGNYISENAAEYESIEICGLVSNICVISNAVIAKAAAPEAKIIVDSALTDSFDKKLDSATYDILRGIQVTVL